MENNNVLTVYHIDLKVLTLTFFEIKTQKSNSSEFIIYLLTYSSLFKDEEIGSIHLVTLIYCIFIYPKDRCKINKQKNAFCNRGDNYYEADKEL